MKKLHLIGLALIAVFAFSAVVASGASAETTLLAEWLINGAAVAAGTATTGTGELLLEDTKAGLAVLCSGSFDGTIGPNGEDLVEKVLSLSGTEVTLATPLVCGSDKFCESGSDITASPEKLPWPTLLVLMENGKFLDISFGAAYFTECLVLGIKVSEECSTTETGYEVLNATGGVEAKGASEPLANCTTGGTEAGIIEFVGANLLTPNGGGTLTVSSE